MWQRCLSKLVDRERAEQLPRPRLVHHTSAAFASSGFSLATRLSSALHTHRSTKLRGCALSTRKRNINKLCARGTTNDQRSRKAIATPHPLGQAFTQHICICLRRNLNSNSSSRRYVDSFLEIRFNFLLRVFRRPTTESDDEGGRRRSRSRGHWSAQHEEGALPASELVNESLNRDLKGDAAKGWRLYFLTKGERGLRGGGGGSVPLPCEKNAKSGGKKEKEASESATDDNLPTSSTRKQDLLVRG